MRLRDELWWRVRTAFERGLISIPDDKELQNELMSIKYEPDRQGRTVIQSKKKMRIEGVPSPNRADALMMTFYLQESFFRRNEERLRELDEWGWLEEKQRIRERVKENSWMAV